MGKEKPTSKLWHPSRFFEFAMASRPESWSLPYSWWPWLLVDDCGGSVETPGICIRYAIMHNQAKFSHIWPGWAIHMGQEIATAVALFAMPKCEEEMHPLQSRLMSISNLEKWKHWFKQTQKRLTKPFPFRRGVDILTVSRCSSFREGDHCWNPATVGTSGPWNYDFSSENGWLED